MSEVSLSELDCLEDFLTPSQDLSQHRGSFGDPWVLVWKVCVQRGAQRDGETLSPALPYRRRDTWEVEGQASDDEN